MDPYTQIICNQILNAYPEIGAVSKLDFIGSIDLQKYSFEQIKGFVELSKYNDGVLAIDKSVLSSTISEIDVMIFVVNGKYIALLTESNAIFSNPGIVGIYELINGLPVMRK